MDLDILPRPSIIIAGAGIGGLSCALHLHGHGFHDIHIFDASRTITPLSTGVNISPSAGLVLRDLGLFEAITANSFNTGDVDYYDRFGSSILSQFNGEYHVPQVSMHRGTLHMVLLRTFKERLGEERIHLNHSIVSLEQKVGSVTANFVQRATGSKAEIDSMNANILIAADGINSTVRRLLYDEKHPPVFPNRMIYSGCVERDRFLTGRNKIWASDPDQTFVSYPISAPDRLTKQVLTAWTAEVTVMNAAEPTHTRMDVDWTQSIPNGEVAGLFKSWKLDVLDISSVIADTEHVYSMPIYQSTPIPRWAFSRLVLLGDAAHPMPSVDTDGASQAIIDAQVLTECLLAHAEPYDVPDALKAYQNIRLSAISDIQRAIGKSGIDRLLEIVHERAPNGFGNLNEIVSKAEMEGLMAKDRASAEAERESVNAKAKEREGMAAKLGLRSPLGSVDS